MYLVGGRHVHPIDDRAHAHERDGGQVSDAEHLPGVAAVLRDEHHKHGDAYYTRGDGEVAGAQRFLAVEAVVQADGVTAEHGRGDTEEVGVQPALRHLPVKVTVERVVRRREEHAGETRYVEDKEHQVVGAGAVLLRDVQQLVGGE